MNREMTDIQYFLGFTCLLMALEPFSYATHYLGHAKQKYLRACAKCTDLDSYRACAESHPSFCSTLIHSTVSNDSVNGQRRP